AKVGHSLAVFARCAGACVHRQQRVHSGCARGRHASRLASGAGVAEMFRRLAIAAGIGVAVFVATLVVCLNSDRAQAAMFRLVGLSHLEGLRAGLVRLFLLAEVVAVGSGFLWT